jgi:MoxR-like ATPase
MKPEPRPLLTPEAVAAAQANIAKLVMQLRRVLLGKEEMIDDVVAALLAQGHVLLEGLPGLGKTELVKALSRLLSLDFRRIQFTPDLLPTDITGSHILEEREGRKEFTFHQGPVFTNLLLADEINRAPAKVQSALLEVMQERQVTIAGETHKVPEPFLVMATQNPIETEGTYPLPEAQVDRFMLKVVVTYPNRAEERAILDAMATSEPDLAVQPMVSGEDVIHARRVVNSVYVDSKIKDYIVDLVLATRDPKQYGFDLNGYVRYGASPRATISLTLAARAWAFLQGRGYVTPQDVKSLALDVLRHRVAVSYEAEAENISSEDIIAKVMETLPVP